MLPIHDLAQLETGQALPPHSAKRDGEGWGGASPSVERRSKPDNSGQHFLQSIQHFSVRETKNMQPPSGERCVSGCVVGRLPPQSAKRDGEGWGGASSSVECRGKPDNCGQHFLQSIQHFSVRETKNMQPPSG